MENLYTSEPKQDTTFYPTCEIFQTYGKIASGIVDLDSQCSQLSGLSEQLWSLAARPQGGGAQRAWCSDQPRGTAHPVKGRGKELTSRLSARQTAEEPGKVGQQPGRSTNDSLTELHIPAKCFHLEESAFSTRKPVSWNSSK